MDMWVVIAAGVVFVLAIIIYVMFMIFLPEWVGISGKVAREFEASHRGDLPPTEGEQNPDAPRDENKKS